MQISINFHTTLIGLLFNQYSLLTRLNVGVCAAHPLKLPFVLSSKFKGFLLIQFSTSHPKWEVLIIRPTKHKVLKCKYAKKRGFFLKWYLDIKLALCYHINCCNHPNKISIGVCTNFNIDLFTCSEGLRKYFLILKIRKYFTSFSRE